MNSESIDDEDKNIDPLVELDKFAAIYSCYPETIFYIYQVHARNQRQGNASFYFHLYFLLLDCNCILWGQVYLDMCRRQQYSDVKLFDGQKQWGYSQYILEGNVLNSEKIRYVIPISVDADIDLKK